MGYVPEWSRANHAKSANITKDSSPTGTNYGIVSKPLFHSEAKMFADGGEVNAKGEKMGEYSGDDEIVKYRMNQIDEKGNDLRIPESAKTTQSQMEVQDMENGSGSEMKSTPQSQMEVQDKESGRSQDYAKSSPAKSIAKAKATPSRDFDSDGSVAVTGNRDMDIDTVATPKSKPYINIPKNSSIGMRQYSQDAESPAVSFFKKLVSSESQRTKAAKKSKDD